MSELKKTLGPVSGAALMLNIVIGAGLLTLPGLAAQAAGPLAIYSWAVCAIAAVPLLIVFIIMGRRYPDAGGIAHFAELAFGRYGYIAASLLFLGAVIFGLPAIAMTGGYYLASVIDVDPALAALVLLLAGAVCQTASPQKASKIATAIASTVIFVLLGMIAVGYWGVDFTSAPVGLSLPFIHDIPLIMAPVLMIFFAFTGWEVAAGISEEFKNPKRDFPIAMILSFAATITLYMLMAFLINVSPTVGNSEAAFAVLIGNVLGPWGQNAVALIAGLIILSNLMGAIWAVSRMIYALSRQQVLPVMLTVDEAGRPLGAVALLVVALALVLLLDYANLLSISDMLHMAGQNFLLLYGVGAMALMVLVRNVASRVIALIAFMIVAALMIYVGDFIGYPAALCLLAVLIWRMQRKNAQPVVTGAPG
ncbi:MAG: amino acid permease [Ahrensia sp.]